MRVELRFDTEDKVWVVFDITGKEEKEIGTFADMSRASMTRVVRALWGDITTVCVYSPDATHQPVM